MSQGCQHMHTCNWLPSQSERKHAGATAAGAVHSRGGCAAGEGAQQGRVHSRGGCTAGEGAQQGSSALAASHHVKCCLAAKHTNQQPHLQPLGFHTCKSALLPSTKPRPPLLLRLAAAAASPLRVRRAGERIGSSLRPAKRKSWVDVSNNALPCRPGTNNGNNGPICNESAGYRNRGQYSLLISASFASNRSRSDTLVAPSASIISRRCPRAHSMPDLTASAASTTASVWAFKSQAQPPNGASPALLAAARPSSRRPPTRKPAQLAAQCARTCIALAAVARQAQHAHGIKAVLPHKVGRRAHGAVLAAVIHNDDFPGEVGALPVTPPLQVAAGRRHTGQGDRGARQSACSRLPAATNRLRQVV